MAMSSFSSCNSSYWMLEFLPDMYWRPIFGTLFVIVSLLATIENTIIILVFYRHPILRTFSNKILISMSVADFFTGLIVGPLYAVMLLTRQLDGNCTSNEARRYFATLFLGASALSVGILSIDRSLHLRRLERYKMATSVLYSVLFMNWFVPIVVPLVALIDAAIYSVILFSIGALAVVIVIISYVFLILSLKKYRSNTSEQMRSLSMERERGAGITVIIIITCYIVMLLPLLMEKLLYSTKYFEGKSKSEHAKAAIFAQLLCMCNSVCNPVIYVSRIPDLRTHVLDVLKFRNEYKRRSDMVVASLTLNSTTSTSF